jgi:S-adenosylmethionine:tRNA ribosyltransferase-isomerase
MHRIADYDYELPKELIAQTPAPERSRSRLMVLDRVSGILFHKSFYELCSYFGQGDALVLNDTKVIPARVEAARSTGGRVEIFLLERKSEYQWEALARPTSRLGEGEALILGGGGEACLDAYLGDGIWAVTFRGLEDGAWLDRVGRMPLPHYIQRDRNLDPRDDLDRVRYQTIYGVHDGAVAAPTAGLHFTPELLEEVSNSGVEIVKLTLHVGVGTFAPLREEDITRHKMHSERYTLSAEAAGTLNRAREAGGRIIAVGTTSARVLETRALDDGGFESGSGRTDLYIYPPYRFKGVDVLLTNFHLPRSSLLLLVCAFAGRDNVLAAYREAVARGYRFYSYGDAMLLGEHLEMEGGNR